MKQNLVFTVGPACNSRARLLKPGTEGAGRVSQGLNVLLSVETLGGAGQRKNGDQVSGWVEHWGGDAGEALLALVTRIAPSLLTNLVDCLF